MAVTDSFLFCYFLREMIRDTSTSSCKLGPGTHYEFSKYVKLLDGQVCSTGLTGLRFIIYFFYNRLKLRRLVFPLVSSPSPHAAAALFDIAPSISFSEQSTLRYEADMKAVPHHGSLRCHWPTARSNTLMNTLIFLKFSAIVENNERDLLTPP